MAKQRISSEQIGQAYAYGTVGGELVDGLKSLSLTDSLNVTTTSTTITAQIAGVYDIHAQQLISTPATANYFCIRKNGATVYHSYTNGSLGTTDTTVDGMVQLAVGDYITIYNQNAITACWTGPHSSFSMFLVKRTS